jgi:hypothetical protein
MWCVHTTFCYAWKLKWPFLIPNPSTHFQFLVLIFCFIFVKVNIVLVLVDLCRIMGVVILALNNGKIGTCKGCKLDFSSNLHSEIQGKFLDHTLQLVIPFVHFRSFFSLGKSFLFQAFCYSFACSFCSSFTRRVYRKFNPPHSVFDHSRLDFV